MRERERARLTGVLSLDFGIITFGICVYVRDFYDSRDCYVRDYYVQENYVAPLALRSSPLKLVR